MKINAYLFYISDVLIDNFPYVRISPIKTVNGAYICPKAYEHRARYRFCTINIKSPPEYDLDVFKTVYLVISCSASFLY